MTEIKTNKGKRGFASMDPEKRKAIAQKGGLSVAKENRSFSRNRDLASSAGRKGGSTPRGDQRARVERLRELDGIKSDA